MDKGNRYFVTVFLLAGFIFGGYAFSEDQGAQIRGERSSEDAYEAFKSSREELYKKALAFKEDGDYNAAYNILKKLIAESPGVSTYEISYVDTLLDQSLTLKEAQSSEWKAKAKEAGHKIKLLYPANTRNADYYLVHAKYSWIIEAQRETHIFKALQKALYFNPVYPVAYIIQGDVFFVRARNTNPDEEQEGAANLAGRASTTNRQFLAEEARTSYKSALSSSHLGDKRKAYVHYKLGELEDGIFGNKDAAKAHWGQAVSLAPESRAGKLARQRLGQ
jgi:hypothetical protein